LIIDLSQYITSTRAIAPIFHFEKEESRSAEAEGILGPGGNEEMKR
jgi:hypothetical protein